MVRFVSISIAHFLVGAARAQFITSAVAPRPSELTSAVTETPTLSSLESLVTPFPSALTSSSSSSNNGVHTVVVGRNNFRFEPQELKDVKEGDVVTFEFYPLDHSVARAEFGSACVPYEYTGNGKVGFWSDWQNLTDVNNIWNLTINSTEPIFYYCGAPGSCINEQMVGVINPNGTQTLAAQIKAAADADFMVRPNEDIPREGTVSLHTPGETGTPNSNHEQPHGHKLSGGAIAGIAVGGVVFLVVAAALFFFVGRAKSLKEVLRNKEATVNRVEGGGAGLPDMPGSPYNGPFSPMQQQQHQQQRFSEYGGLPAYGQHHATDSHPSGWTSPQMGHMSMAMSPGQQPADNKPQHQYAPVEMHSPEPRPVQQHITAELEAPVRPPGQN
ncbi:hypothetical protein BU24DRAFT_481210 [Aaosphaeria arxii CBS 175.79]|uniref:Cupredoxin n=1 Tax=Aaosphaeria arxii CBS 175.79 TaxID=1450172 RepID=A0A6A5XUE7_9PLEO|nr:uncharacterized protein BU24DRAFT_481210 [Aaosphaeria arxii CBS 175.79]KAF2016573.1 hypothetical protein BU24DRAFT_481210 [Aaosphaeria arxii CBS 175.79]